MPLGKRQDGEALAPNQLYEPTCAGLPASEVSLGSASVCTLLDGGKVSCLVDNLFPMDTAAVDALTDLVQVDTYGHHACAVHSDGSLSCWGDNEGGAVGEGTQEPRSAPVKIPGLSDVVQVSLGFAFSCVRHASGTVSCWGENEQGQLGDGTTTQRSVPALVSELDDVVQIDAGYDFACARLSSGKVRCWGSNHQGTLGIGSSDFQRLTPTDVVGISSAAHVSCGSSHACVISQDSSIVCWGDNTDGQLGKAGDGSTTPGSVTFVSHARRSRR